MPAALNTEVLEAGRHGVSLTGFTGFEERGGPYATILSLLSLLFKTFQPSPCLRPSEPSVFNAVGFPSPISANPHESVDRLLSYGFPRKKFSHVNRTEPFVVAAVQRQDCPCRANMGAPMTAISFEAFRSCGRTLPHVCAQSDVTTWGPKGKRKREEVDRPHFFLFPSSLFLPPPATPMLFPCRRR